VESRVDFVERMKRRKRRATLQNRFEETETATDTFAFAGMPYHLSCVRIA